MKKEYLFLLTVFLGLGTFNSPAQDSGTIEGNFVIYRQNDPVGQSLDYSNTICDTLLYDDQVILLEISPLLQLKGISLPSGMNREQLLDSIYNCTRGFTATWKLEDKELVLLSIHPCKDADKQFKKILKLKQIRRIGEGPVKADWVSGKIVGGADAIETNYGYAFKQEYEFEFHKGVLVNDKSNAFPYGALENEESLTKFLQENGNVLLGTFLHIDRFVSFRHGISRTEEGGWFKYDVPLYVTPEGNTYYAYRHWERKTTVYELSLDKSLLGRSSIAKMNFVNMIPHGSFYPRFLRGEVIYQPNYIEFSFNLYGDIIKANFVNYIIRKKTSTDGFWIRHEDEEPH
jgi:hypothetical protein